MAEHELAATINAPPDAVFQLVSDVRNLPRYLPTTRVAREQGEGRVRVEGEVGGHRYEADGYFHADATERRLEWGADEPRRYSGWLTVTEADSAGSSRVRIHLRFGPNMGEAPTDQEIQAGLEAALRSLDELVTGGVRNQDEATI
jgi:uncharacterized protein YndB with AHSA1/START domain